MLTDYGIFPRSEADVIAKFVRKKRDPALTQ